ncbi:ComF family protein [Litorilinea aerophila]|uniref:ComF family protein n=1 Tax=Litorilinea aerophila TaxID=1204385 RepID=A0A540VBH5_9CHLR|nr:ComF family protein [Litorilinea aerophila]
MYRLSPGPIPWWQRVVDRCVDLFFPPACAGCGQVGYPFCPRCAQRVEPVPRPCCTICGRPQPEPTDACPACAAALVHPVTRIRAAALYTSPLREAIHAFKYGGRPELAQSLGRYLVVAFGEADWDTPVDLVVPVPLHRDRLAERGYNQSQLLAQALCRWLHLPLGTDALTRVRQTRQQVGLDAAARQENVLEAFVASSAAVQGRTLLLVDDVYTTGATLKACAAAALEAGATRVYGLTLAMAGHGQTGSVSGYTLPPDG